MKSIIKKNLLRKYLTPEFYGPWFAPFFAVMTKHAEQSENATSRCNDGGWVWTDVDAVEECLASTWDMLGHWNARRAVRVDRRTFDRTVPHRVRRLALCLNRHEVCSLWKLGQLDRTYRMVFIEIVDTVLELSKIKGTLRTEPMFGSKIAHHFFPTVVPVFDTAMVRKGVLQTSVFTAFRDADHEGWLPADLPDAALEFGGYLAFLAAQVSEAQASDLSAVRQAFGNAVVRCAPNAMAGDPRSLVWRLDAKVAEACALGEAHREGWLSRRPDWEPREWQGRLRR